MLAQSVEHLTFNQVVTGSIPVQPTILPQESTICGLLAQSVEHLTFNQVVTGSIPVQPTILCFISICIIELTPITYFSAALSLVYPD